MNVGVLCFMFCKGNVYMNKQPSLKCSSVVDDFFSVTTLLPRPMYCNTDFFKPCSGIPAIIINGLNEKSCFLCVHLRNLSFALILLTFNFVLRDLDIMRNEETV